MNDDKKHIIWDKQTSALRNPSEIIGSATFDNAGILADSLKYDITGSFLDILQETNLTLFVTREYEHLVIALNVMEGKFNQTFINLPHPSGLTISPDKKNVYIAATRNPNQIFEFGITDSVLNRKEEKSTIETNGILFPSRTKFYPGAYYLHDLAFIGNDLHANTVGQNGIIKVNMNDSNPEEVCWYPKSIEDKSGVPDLSTNYLQLNSIASGKTLEDSFFSASGHKPGNRKPGHKNYPVDKKGVIFSAKTREPIAFGLTRPHSARLNEGKIWVDNSGYGEFGVIDGSKFEPVAKLPGWTRGLFFKDDIAFVGVSRVLKRFSQYAPGLNDVKQKCGIIAIEKQSGKELGGIFWNYGNQVFSIEGVSADSCKGFIYKSIYKEQNKARAFYYKSIRK